MNLPGPVGNLRASLITNHSVTLMWDPNDKSDNVVQYDIFYKEIYNNSNQANLFLGNTVRRHISGLPFSIPSVMWM